MKRIQYILSQLRHPIFRGAIALAIAFSVSLIPLGDKPVWADSVRIPALQGAAHQTPFVTAESPRVEEVPGIVTVVLDKGFYFQDAEGDGNDATSDGLFVFMNRAPETSEGDRLGIGDAVRVTGTVVEFTPGGRDANNLSTTQIDASGQDAVIIRDSIDNPLPLPVVLGQAGRIPPDMVIEDDGFELFDPDSDGMDFFESLEGMLVEVDDAIVVEPTNRYDEFIVLGDGGSAASTLSVLGGAVISDGDLNPERIWVKNTDHSTLKVHVGDRFERPIVGVLGYSFGNYKVFTTQPLPTVEEAKPTPEVTTLKGTNDQLTIAGFNVENLDPSDGSRFGAIAQRIVENLQSPDIVALVEVQDNNGTGESGGTEADRTYRLLTDAIQQAGGPDYAFTDVAPTAGLDGGQPGGNIRVGFIYQPARVALAEHPRGTASQAVKVIAGANGPTLSVNPGRIDPTNRAFDQSRKPLVAEFEFNGEPVFVIASHFNSKRGDGALFGKVQPPDFPSEIQRAQQAAVVHQFIDELLAVDADANVVVLGDLNDFQFSNAVQTLAGDDLQNLIDFLPVGDRYTYIYEGNSQALDHILVSQHPLFDGNAEYDIVHVNVGFPDDISDHDPILMRFIVPEDDTPGLPDPTLVTDPLVTDLLVTDPGASATPPGTSTVMLSILPNEAGRSLRDRLAVDYAPKGSLGYNTGRDILYGQIENKNGVVEGIYTGYQIQLNPTASPRMDAFAKGINAEHTWPQSKGAKGAAKSDLHHLFPSRVRVNGTRGNFPFADIPDPQTDRWFLGVEEIYSLPTVNIDDYSEFDPGQFEPREVKKGDVARAMFYFYTMYEDQANDADSGYFDLQRNTLCEWHRLDPADEAEIARSHAIAQTAQGNENPFVLDPTLATRAYCS
ncbi:MAG: endonuclease [Leptolyngbyaceae bacterium]|nr:endonuclease [Leptolyngbyaceae bacterium]